VRAAVFTLLVEAEDRFLVHLAGRQREQLNDLLSRIMEL